MESSPVADESPKTHVILGCKRAGTSFVAEALGRAGIAFETCGNGHNEDAAFCDLNDAILADAGGDWNELPADDRVASAVAAREREYRALIAERAGRARRWGWKDPRQGAIIQHVLPWLDGDVYLVCVFRRPRRVAESMHRTWGTPHAEGRRVYNDYCRRILNAVREFVGLW